MSKSKIIDPESIQEFDTIRATVFAGDLIETREGQVWEIAREPSSRKRTFTTEKGWLIGAYPHSTYKQVFELMKRPPVHHVPLFDAEATQ